MIHTPTSNRLSDLRRPGFTLVEMMIVIAIIGILVTISVLVGRSVVAKAKVDQCSQILLVLDDTLSEYQAENGSIPPFDERQYQPPTGNGVPGNERKVRREVAVYLEQVKGYAGIDKMLGAIDSRFLVKRNELYRGIAGERYAGSVDNDDDRVSVRDPWGMEILYIHPTKENRDAFDMLGLPANDRPYFVSAGPDLYYYTVEDNIYSYDAVDRTNVNNGGQ